MGKLASVTFTGASGMKYDFDVYPWGTNFRPIGAVYFTTKRYSSGNGYSHAKIYVGQTGDLLERFDNHHKIGCFRTNGANCICIHPEGVENSRRRIESDLISNYNPPCND